MAAAGSNEGLTPIGQEWLRRELGLEVPASAIESYVVQGARRTADHGSRILEFYPRSYATDPTPVSNVRFALRHETFDLGILVAALRAMAPAELQAWVRDEPTGAYSRRAWFLYETFTGKTLDLEDTRAGNYVEALDPERYIVADRCNSARHRVIDNLLGGAGLCPTVRRTARLTEQMGIHIDAEARALIESYDPVVLARAVNYLYTKETRSSFAIEGETPSAGRTDRFVAALKAAPGFRANKESLVRMQGDIVDPRYAAKDWRDFQNFVGETVRGYREEVHFIGPRPQDVPGLMEGWGALTARMVGSAVDPVVAAAVSSFAFVFVHPFADGNGRIHRFLMHHVLAKRGYSPEGVIFPVSAAILRDRRSYDQALETFSKPLFDFIHWHWTSEQEIVVTNDTGDLYRYFDATVFAEYLYERVGDTVRRDLREELGFVAIYDRAFNGVREIVDMPDRRASLFVRLCMQNGGRLSATKRAQFPELTDTEVALLETQVQQAIVAEEAGHPNPVK
jgi:hypothetical protein